MRKIFVLLGIRTDGGGTESYIDGNKIYDRMTLGNYFEYLSSLLAFQEFLLFTGLCQQKHC